MSTAYPSQARIAESFGSVFPLLTMNGRQIIRRDPPISSWKRFSAAMNHYPRIGRPTAPPATILWTKSARCSTRGEHPLDALWARASARPLDFTAEEELARRQILQRSFAAQQEANVRALCAIAQSDLNTRDFSSSAIRRCLTEILAHFPVYRTYAQVENASSADDTFLSRAVAGAKATCLLSDRWLVDILGRWLSGRRISRDVGSLQATALNRFQQLSAPLCAKAVETPRSIATDG
jgi:maltooligosyltrehalose synthase